MIVFFMDTIIIFQNLFFFENFDDFDDGLTLPLHFRGLMTDLRILRISSFLANWIRATPSLLWALGYSAKGAKILTMSVWPHNAATWSGVSPLLSRALGLSTKGANIRIISVWPLNAASWTEVSPSWCLLLNCLGSTTIHYQMIVSMYVLLIDL